MHENSHNNSHSKYCWALTGAQQLYNSSMFNGNKILILCNFEEGRHGPGQDGGGWRQLDFPWMKWRSLRQFIWALPHYRRGSSQDPCNLPSRIEPWFFHVGAINGAWNYQPSWSNAVMFDCVCLVAPDFPIILCQKTRG